MDFWGVFHDLTGILMDLALEAFCDLRLIECVFGLKGSCELSDLSSMSNTPK